jgi:hypothetical protein
VSAALGWGGGTVAVQAGWRDQQDLIGYYNTFEKRFQEEDFLVFLYSAATDQWSTTPYLLLLDEANLSSMEYYFASFLSALELQDQQYVQLAPAAIANAPFLTDQGRRLAIPENVWFVATANQDETTRRFAPKTIDRSTVLELKRVARAPEFAAKPQAGVLEGVSMEKLQNAFARARAENMRNVERLAELPTDLPRAIDDAELAVGERFRSHMLDFSTAFLACGGSLERAVESMWLHKVLYRLPERGEGDPDAMDQLASALTKMWGLNGFRGSIPESWTRRLSKASSA